MIMSEVFTVPTLEDLLEQCEVTEDFSRDLLSFRDSHRPTPRISFPAGNPPVKVLRAVMGLLEKRPGLAIDSVEVQGFSGCSDFRGELSVNGGEAKYRFVWDCAWKANQMGWTDFMGYPDQQKAARTFGHQCFQQFEEMN
jgi:hypothetical protein